jgi:multiple sugar transport system substrate-binding protein
MINRVVLLLATALLVAGCTGFTTEAETENPVPNDLPPKNPRISSQPITLEVWLDLDFTRDNTLFEEMVEEFEEVYPQIEVEIVSFVRESMPQRVELAVESGIPPDVVQGHVYAMAGQGLAMPLDDLWAEWETTSPNATSQFLPSALAETMWEDRHFGVPLDVYTQILFYNKDHFDTAGLPYPEGDYTLAQLEAATSTLTNPDNNHFGFGFTTDPWYVYAWVSGAGGDVLVKNPDNSLTLTLNSTTNIDALTYLTGMVEKGYGPLPSSRPRDYEETRQKFLNEEISMYFGESQDIHLIQSTHPDFPLGVAGMPITPALESAASVFGSSGLFIPRGARHRAAAFEFMKWATSDRYAFSMARRVGRYPAKTWLQSSPEFTENLTLIPFFNQLNAARPYRLDLLPVAEEAFANAIKAAFYKNMSPAEALQQAQAIGEESLSNVPPSPQ